MLNSFIHRHLFFLVLLFLPPVLSASAWCSALPETGKKGLVVHLGCGDGRQTVQLAGTPGRLIHGLSRNAADVAAARKLVWGRGLYGKVTISQHTGTSLPYAGNVVNLLFVEEPGGLAKEEIDRALAPLGEAYIKQGETWVKHIKPWPSGIDEWSHYLHDSTNNAVAGDTRAGPPKHHQWIAGPKWARSHDHLSTTSAVVSSAGRIFSIVDEGLTASVALDPHWRLVARDAFSGVLLWKRPIELWEGHLRGFRSGPPHLPRRLVAAGDRVYVTLGYGEPVTCLDAVTGGTIRTYNETKGTLEFVCSGGVLYLVVGEGIPETVDAEKHALNREGIWHWWPIYPVKLPGRHLMAIEAETGRVLWTKDDAETAEILPVTLAVQGDELFFQNYGHLISLNAKTGHLRWASKRPVSRSRPAWSTPTVVVKGTVVISADRAVNRKEAQKKGTAPRWVVNSLGGRAPAGTMIAFSTETGRRLWQAPCKECYNAPVDVLIVDGLVWSGDLVRSREPGITKGLDLKTGESTRTRPNDQKFFRIGMGHHRCYRNKATTNYLVLGRDGIEFIDVKTGEGRGNHWVRGACQYGVMPCNGLIYSPPHSCACHIETKLDSFLALAPGREIAVDSSPRLVKGPAYEEKAGGGEPPAVDWASSSDWPTYRGTISRAGCVAGCRMPAGLKKAWETPLPGGDVRSVTVADGRVFAPCHDTNTLYALDTAEGGILWSFTAGGPVDSPPTIHGPWSIFGCADGWIYSLRATDGELAWKFRASQTARRIVAYGRIESTMPVHGSILVHNGIVHAVAGRTSFLDGGINLVRLEAATGRLLSETPIPNALPDILSSDGSNLFLRTKRLDMKGKVLPGTVPHVFSSAGFLDGNWWHRTYMQVGSFMASAWGAWPRAALSVPAGRLLVRNVKDVYAFSRSRYHRNGVHVGLGEMHYVLKAWDTSTKQGMKRPRWSRKVPILVRAMVEGDGKLFLAGPPDTMEPVPHDGKHIYTRVPAGQRQRQEAALHGRLGGKLLVVSTGDGSTLAEYPLDSPPAWDSMAAARGSLYFTTLDGKVVCMRP